MNKTILIKSGLVIAVLLMITISGCENDGISEDQAQIEYNRRDQLKNMFDNEILPLHEAFITETTTLSEKTEQFEQNTTPENLNSLQNSWKSTVDLWKRCEVYNIGDISDSFIHTRIHTWPTNDTNIETFIAGDQTIDLSFINSVGSSSKGIAAMEYLLFNEAAAVTLEAFQLDSRRLDYVAALSEDLKNLASEIHGLWVNYGPEFKVAVASDLNGGQNQTINAMVTLTEKIIISKLGRALGETNGGTIDIEELEAFRSDNSLSMIENNISELHKTYNGNFKENTRHIGFDDYIIELGNQDLRDRIKAAFETVETEISNFDQSLNLTLQSNSEKVIALQGSLNELLVLLKVDMASYIGSTITINDNDGD